MKLPASSCEKTAFKKSETACGSASRSCKHPVRLERNSNRNCGRAKGRGQKSPVSCNECVSGCPFWRAGKRLPPASVRLLPKNSERDDLGRVSESWQPTAAALSSKECGKRRRAAARGRYSRPGLPIRHHQATDRSFVTERFDRV